MKLSKAIYWLAAVNKRYRITRWIPAPLLHQIRGRAMQSLVSRLPDRIYLEQEILPCLAQQQWQKLLFVGCESYTAQYGHQFANGSIEFWTTDIKPESARWGEPQRHVTCDVCKLEKHFPQHEFDAVILNGVFGFGVNSSDQMETAVFAIHKVLKLGGLLLLGWNRDLIQDPCELDCVKKTFAHTTSLPLPTRKSFCDVTHVFDILTAREFEISSLKSQ